MAGTLARRVAEFLRREDGPTAVEYAILLATIILACFVAISAVGGNANSAFTKPALVTALE